MTTLSDIGGTYRTKSEAVYVVIREMIMTNQLEAGEPVHQEQLAKTLGTSVTPLREALRRLESEGYVRNEAHRGVIVAPLDLSELSHLYAVKEHLECLAAHLTAGAATDDERATIRELARPQPAEHGNTAVAEWYANKQFHRAIYRASHNPTLIGLLDVVWEKYDRYFNVFRKVVFYDETAASEHAEIADAVARGDSADAVAWVRRHHMHGYQITAIEPSEAEKSALLDPRQPDS